VKRLRFCARKTRRHESTLGNMETQQDFSTKDKYIIGSLVAAENPETAKTYLSSYNTQKQKAIDGDPHNLNYYFLSFCRINSLDPFEIIGALHKQDKVDTRRLFIGAMVRIYRPQILFTPICPENGIGQYLCILLKLDNGNMSKTIDEVKEWYGGNLYNFRDDVTDTVDALASVRKGYVGTMFKKVA
jgi:hypothetical protein